MKKKLVTLILGGILSAAIPLWADTWTDPDTGYTWTCQRYVATAEIYNGGNAAISPSPIGAVAIPSTLGGKPVTSIGYVAFYCCRGLTSVTIGSGEEEGTSNVTTGTIVGGITKS